MLQTRSFHISHTPHMQETEAPSGLVAKEEPPRSTKPRGDPASSFAQPPLRGQHEIFHTHTWSGLILTKLAKLADPTSSSNFSQQRNVFNRISSALNKKQATSHTPHMRETANSLQRPCERPSEPASSVAEPALRGCHEVGPNAPTAGA